MWLVCYCVSVQSSHILFYRVPIRERGRTLHGPVLALSPTLLGALTNLAKSSREIFGANPDIVVLYYATFYRFLLWHENATSFISFCFSENGIYEPISKSVRCSPQRTTTSRSISRCKVTIRSGATKRGRSAQTAKGNITSQAYLSLIYIVTKQQRVQCKC